MDFLEDNLYALTAGFLITLVFFAFVTILRKTKLPYYKQETLLTPTELRFYKAFAPLLNSNIGVAFKVRLGDIITCSDKDWARGYGPRISAKHVDFALYDKTTTKILGCIELDDSSHQRRDRKRRDKFFNSAFQISDVPLLRIEVRGAYNPKDLKKLLSELLA